MEEIFKVKYEAKIPCEGRPEIEHAWLEGQLANTGVWAIHICEFKDGEYSNEATYLRPSELEKLHEKIDKLKSKKPNEFS